MSLNAAPLRLSTTDPTFEAAFKARLHWSADTDAAIEQRVADILSDVQARGDAAVLAYTQRFDGLAAGATTRRRKRPVARAGATATKTARCSARR